MLISGFSPVTEYQNWVKISIYICKSCVKQQAVRTVMAISARTGAGGLAIMYCPFSAKFYNGTCL